MLRLSDRVKEYSLTTGSGIDIVLEKPFKSFQSFNRGIGDGNTTYYTIENASSYEVGIGTYTSGTNTLSRDIVLDSSNNNQRINLFDTSIVFCTYPSDYSVFLNLDGYISGQYPFYSGIAFPDGTIQTTSLDGIGLANKVAYWEDENTLNNIGNITWDSTNQEISISGKSIFIGDVEIGENLIVSNNSIFLSDLNVSGILTSIDSVLTNPELKDSVFYRSSAGCFFHAYVDNAYDNMIALYSSNEANPYWKLGIKSYTNDFTVQPNTGYVEGENGQIGIYATPSNYIVITYVNGFWVTQDNVNIFNVDTDQGVRIFNQDPTTTPLTVRSAPAQAANIQEWETYSSTVVASISNSGQISVKSVKYPDNTIQTTAYIPSTDSYINVNTSLNLTTTYGIIFVDCSSNNITLTLPDAVDAGGKRIVIKRKAGGINSLTILPSGSQYLDSLNSFSMPHDNQSITVVSDNSNWYII